MLTVSKSAVVSLVAAILLAACGGSSEPPKEASGEAAPVAPAAESAALTAEACKASGGTVVGDIGDGAIHRPDYRCASGSKPTGRIRAAEGGPVAIEGSVCCPK